jgi:hypothetical protein
MMGFGTFVRNVITNLWGPTHEVTITVPITFTGYKKAMNEPKISDTLCLERMVFTDESTIGELYIDGDFFCYTLEDTCRRNKVPGKTAIPAGHYEIIVTQSVRFNRPMPLLLDVPNYEGIRIHTGNTALDTDGCILVGLRQGENVIYDSRKTFDLLFPEIEKRLAKGKLYISIIGGYRAEAV